MILLICVLTLAIASILVLLESKKPIFNRNDGIEIGGWTVVLILGATLIITGCVHLGQNYTKQKYEIKYETLNNDKDNPFLGEKIAEFNESVIWHQRYQRDFWIGPFIPNIYDDMKLIETNSY